MKATEQTLQEVDRAIRKVAEKFPSSEEATMLTDIHLRVSQDSGELLAYDDDDNEINRCVVEQWIENKDDDFYQHVAATLRASLLKQKEKIEQMSILKPYSFVLEDDDKETIEELYLVDDDTVILQEELIRAGVLPTDYDFEAHKELVPMQAGDVPITYADTTPLERDFGFKPSTSLRTGLRAFAEWYARYYGTYK